ATRGRLLEGLAAAAKEEKTPDVVHATDSSARRRTARSASHPPGGVERAPCQPGGVRGISPRAARASTSRLSARTCARVAAARRKTFLNRRTTRPRNSAPASTNHQ